jgi:DHA1 family bicyclomycin/chloramphenicol resistance-like MFS transporter
MCYEGRVKLLIGPSMKRFLSAGPAFALIASGTVVSIAGTDLVLPAVPSLPAALGGTPAEAQYVLAAFVAGSGLGLILFGELGARFDPGFIRALFAPERAASMIGLFGSIESLVPALAPIAGAWLLVSFGWRASFIVIGVLGLVLTALMSVAAQRLPRIARQSNGGSYGLLLRNPVYLRYASSHAFALGGLLTFVFAAPAVMVGPLGGTIADFVWLQVMGIAFFILAANAAGRLATRFGPERLIVGGTAVAAVAALAILAYALSGGRNPSALIPPWIVWNLGFGLRGPPGFLQAVIAARGDDSRGSALVILAILLTAALGAALAAPYVASGLTGAAAVAAAIEVGAVAWLAL